MKGGMVIRLRVAPLDCLYILQLLDVAGIDASKLSFSAATSAALSTLIEVAKKAEIIQEESGFDYTPRMEKYLGIDKRGKRKEQAERLFEKAKSGLSLAPANRKEGKNPDLTQEELIFHLSRLEEKKEAEGLNEEEQERYDEYTDLLYN